MRRIFFIQSARTWCVSIEVAPFLPLLFTTSVFIAELLLLNKWSVVCGCILHMVQRGEWWCVSLTLCRYDIWMGVLLVLSWARVRRVSLGSESSEEEILGAC